MGKYSSVDARLLEGLGLTAEQIAALSEKERAYLFQCLEEMAETGTSPTATSLVLADYKWEPVTMERFLSDEYYMGKLTQKMYPAVRASLIESFDGDKMPLELILAGSLGWGKTTLAAVALVYLLYRITCMRNPQDYYGLMPGADIVFGLYSVNLEQAEDTSFGKMKSWIDNIPYFLQRCPRKKNLNSAIKFPGCPVRVIFGSNELHTIGKDMYAFLLDEANFLQAPNGEVDQGVAYGIYNNALNRVQSRFQDTVRGEPAGIAILASSKRTKVSFLEGHMKEAQTQKAISEGRTRVYSYAQWEVKAASNWKKPRFRVEIGDRLYPSRILPEGESPRGGADVIHVPGEFYERFVGDVDKALRDLAGVASESLMPLFHDKSVIARSCTAAHQHPFSRQELVININEDISIDDYFKADAMFTIVRSRYRMRLNPECPRYIHVDLAATQDAMGIAMGHIAGMRTVKRVRKDGTYYEDKAPLVIMDFTLRVKPPTTGEIDIGKARAFILSLIDMGVPVKMVSYDGWQSRESVQGLKKLGIIANTPSLDKNDEPYLVLRQTIIENRLVRYRYEHLETELIELERDLDERKVDHPDRSPTTGLPGSKDVADALCGVVWAAAMDKTAMLLLPVPHVSSAATLATKVEVTGGAHLWKDLDKEAG